MNKKNYVICYSSEYMRDAQVFLGDPKKPDQLSEDWTDADCVLGYIGQFCASSKEEAIAMAAQFEGCHPDALISVAEYIP